MNRTELALIIVVLLSLSVLNISLVILVINEILNLNNIK